MLIVSAYLIGRQPDINTKLKMRSLSTFMSDGLLCSALYIVYTHAGNSSKSLASNAHTLMLKILTLFFF